MTMEEVKAKLLGKIDELLEGANADDVRKLSEAYSLLNKDVLLEHLAKNHAGMFGGVCNGESGNAEN